ncbi:MAG TPA: hypothetical protein VGI98_01060 [Candidatus Limnocylindrales bacterium]
MDDPELEARLRSHLHARLDDAMPSAELEAAVRGGLRAEPVQGGGLRWVAARAPRLRIGLAGAAVVLMALVIGGVVTRPPAGTATSPSPSAPSEGQSFIVLPPTAAIPDKTATEAAMVILEDRLRTLGVGTFSGAAGNAIQFEVPAGGPSNDVVRQVLGAAGRVELVPLPAADYGPGGATAVPGQPLPKPEPPLFGGPVRVVVERATDPASGALSTSLNLTATDAPRFAAYTAANVGQQLAILVDGDVALVPIIQSAITDGHLTVTSPTGTPTPAWAVLLSGPLPDAWRGATVPVLISRDDAAALAFMEPGVQGAPETPNLDARLIAGSWRPIWTVEAHGSFPDLHCTRGPACPSPSTIEIVLIDAINAGILGYEQPSP